MTRNNLLGRAARLLSAALAAVVWCGCQGAPVFDSPIGPDYVPANVHRLGPRLPSTIRRVAVLPLTAADATDEAAGGVAALEPILRGELNRAARFELVAVPAERLRRLLGKATLAAEDPLPAGFLETMRTEFGCEAALFSRLSQYRAYPPLAVGWKFKLVDTTSGQVWWALDELFDASDPHVVNSARRYQSAHQKYKAAVPGLLDSHTILLSPRQFAGYAAAAAVATLPPR